MEDAIEASKEDTFSTNLTFTGIDFETVDGEELQEYAENGF